MQPIHATREPNRVDRTIGIAAEVPDNLDHACTSKPFERLGPLVLETALRHVEGMAHEATNLLRKRLEVLARFLPIHTSGFGDKSSISMKYA